MVICSGEGHPMLGRPSSPLVTVLTLILMNFVGWGTLSCIILAQTPVQHPSLKKKKKKKRKERKLKHAFWQLMKKY